MENLKKQFDNTAELYRIELCKMWEIGYSDTYWIGDDVGGVLDVCADLPLSYDDVRYVVENKVARETVAEWIDYLTAVDGLKRELYNINLQHWCMGCPRVDASAWYEQLWHVKEGKQKNGYRFPFEDE